jgi:hypothetical protein
MQKLAYYDQCSRICGATGCTGRHGGWGTAEGCPQIRRPPRTNESVVVPVPFVGRVPVPVVHIVGVALVRHPHVAALQAVLVGVTLVRHMPGLLALVDVVTVDAVNVAVVRVVGVIAVRELDVATVRAVGVLMTAVRDVLDGVWHDVSPPWLGLVFNTDINI